VSVDANGAVAHHLGCLRFAQAPSYLDPRLILRDLTPGQSSATRHFEYWKFRFPTHRSIRTRGLRGRALPREESIWLSLHHLLRRGRTCDGRTSCNACAVHAERTAIYFWLTFGPFETWMHESSHVKCRIAGSTYIPVSNVDDSTSPCVLAPSPNAGTRLEFACRLEIRSSEVGRFGACARRRGPAVALDEDERSGLREIERLGGLYEIESLIFDVAGRPFDVPRHYERPGCSPSAVPGGGDSDRATW
jgi:hypothetical protein